MLTFSVFGIFDRERLVRVVTEKKAVEQEELHSIGFFRGLK
jgi:hypothetical protein